MTYTVHGILQARIFPSPGDLPKPGIKPRSPTLQADSLPAEPQGKPIREALGKSPTQIVAKCHLTLVIPTYIKPHYPRDIYTGQMNNKEETWCVHTDAYRHTTTHGDRHRFMECFSFLKIFLCGPFLKSLLNLLQSCFCNMFLVV